MSWTENNLRYLIAACAILVLCYGAIVDFITKNHSGAILPH